MLLPISFFVLLVTLTQKHPCCHAEELTALAVRDGADQLTTMSAVVKFPWEGLLQSAPLSVFLLGQLVVISGRRDFELHLNVTHPYKRLRHTTFRPTIIQVSNEGWVAFNQAHLNMDEIRQHMLSVPRNVRAALKILTKSPEQISRYIKLPLNAIQQSGDEGVRLSLDTYAKFYEVQLLLAEVAESLAARQGATQEQLRQASEDRKLAEEERQMQIEREAKVQRQLDIISRDMRKANDDYVTAIRSIPSGFKAFVMDMISVLNPAKLIGTVTNAFGNVIGGVKVADMSVGDLSLINMANNIRKGMSRVLNELNLDNNFNLFDAVKTSLEDLKRQAGRKSNSHFFLPVNELITSGQSLISDLISNPEEDQNDLLKDRVKQLIFNAKAIASVQPQLNSATTQVDYGSYSGGGAHFKVDLQLAKLKSLQQRYDQTFARLMMENESLKEILMTLGQLNFDVINFNEILAVIQQAIKALSQIRKNWAQLVEFFQLISNIAKVTLAEQVGKFLSFTQTGLDNNEVEFLLNVMRQEVKESVIGTATVANFLHSLSAAYMNVSNRHLMSRLAGLNSLVTITDTTAQEAKLAQLHMESVSVQTEVAAICVQHKQQFERGLEAEKSRIEAIFARIGPPSEEDQLAIEKGNQLQTEWLIAQT